MGIKQKIINLKDCWDNTKIYDNYYNREIDENLIYFESRNGEDLVGNIFRIIEEISTGKYGEFKVVLFAHKNIIPKIRQLKRNYNLKIDKIITNDDDATKVLERAKYIFTDSGIRPKYIKRPGQVFVNVWHGTPLKHMGVDNTSEIVVLGHSQHSLLSADYLLYPNEFMCEKMLNAYMIEKIYQGKILFEGYPRNSVFFDKKNRLDLKDQLGLGQKEVFVYMPTHRDVIAERKDDRQRDEIVSYLHQLDENLEENQVVIVKLHAYNQSKIDFTKFSHIIPFPDGYEIYDIVNLADKLITDYSSIFFDFANSRRKIILFNYDEEEYLKERGIYIPLEDLPFPKARNVDELLSELNSDKDYDDTSFVEEFCRYDNPDAVKNICEEIFLNRDVCRKTTIENTKKNVLIYAGGLYNNGITSALINLLENVDLERYNYFLTFKQWEKNIIENHESIFAKIPEGVEFLPLRTNLTPTLKEKLQYNKFVLSDEKTDFTPELQNLFKRSYLRQFANVKIDTVIDFDGYHHDESMIFSQSGINNAIWVHSDMVQENRLRGNQNLNILNEAYSTYKKVVIVSDGLKNPTVQISKMDDNIVTVHNIINHKKILRNAEKDFILDDGGEMYPERDVDEILNRDCIKFITIGRFSPEKGHERLLKAFDEFCNQNSDAHLFIIGGRGSIYEETVELVGSLNHPDNVTLIKGISNPMPVLKKCDLFVFPSFYEGWGIVILEANLLNVPVIATDIAGVQWIRKYGGNVVENSQNGILSGMYEFTKGNLGMLDMDYEEFNRMAVEEFYSIIDEE